MIMSCSKNWKARFGKPNEVVRRSQFRTLYNKTYFRIFAFWDKKEKIATLVLATHGIIKKTGKTPEKEIEKAENIRLRYFELKNKRNEK